MVGGAIDRLVSRCARSRPALAIVIGLALSACSGAEGFSSEDLTGEETGEELYTLACSECHGTDPDNRDSGLDLEEDQGRQEQLAEQLTRVISDGVDAMPGFADTLTEAQIEKIVDHLRAVQQEQH